jgi:hypothetical protein
MLRPCLRALTALGAFLSAPLAAIPCNAQGLELRVRIAVEQLPGANHAPPPRAFLQSVPDGKAAMTLETDGRSVRRTVAGRMAGLSNGSVLLVPAGKRVEYFLDPAARTYTSRERRTSPFTALPDDAVAKVRRSGTAELFLGRQTHRVQLTVEVSPMIRFDLDVWCDDTLRIPDSLRDLLDFAQPYLIGRAREEYHQACPVPLRTDLRGSMTPGFALVVATESIKSIAPAPARFQLPRDYRPAQ